MHNVQGRKHWRLPTMKWPQDWFDFSIYAQNVRFAVTVFWRKNGIYPGEGQWEWWGSRWLYLVSGRDRDSGKKQFRSKTACTTTLFSSTSSLHKTPFDTGENITMASRSLPVRLEKCDRNSYTVWEKQFIFGEGDKMSLANSGTWFVCLRNNSHSHLFSVQLK